MVVSILYKNKHTHTHTPYPLVKPPREGAEGFAHKWPAQQGKWALLSILFSRTEDMVARNPAKRNT